MNFKLATNLVCVLAGVSRTALGAAPLVLQDFENASGTPSVWVVNLPNENASVHLSSEDPPEGQRCLKLHYHFLGAGKFQYLGIPNKVSVQTPIHQLRFWLKGDNSKCSYGVQIVDAHGETHQYSRNTGQGGIVDFTGWREVAIDLDSGHETWGGDKNGKLDYPLTAITFTIGQPTAGNELVGVEGDLFFDSLRADSQANSKTTPTDLISVTTPAYGSDIEGDTTISLAAPGFRNLEAKCWKQGDGFGSDSIVAKLAVNGTNKPSFVFPANQYAHGPITVRIHAVAGSREDNCYLQLYNRGGISWNEGLPHEPPPGAAGMRLVFSDDFNGPLSISSTDKHATYYDHKPPGGTQDFSVHTFASHDSAKNPFTQVDTYLRIRASDATHSAGLLSSLKNDATGITAKVPCYFECRFIAPNAIGTWPAFWLLTDYMTDYLKGRKVPCDELDIIEAYGGEGPHEPNAFDGYMVTPHCWDQGETGKSTEKAAFEMIHNPVRMRRLGIPSTWFETFHTYGCKITGTETVYYCDNIEVGRHPTFPISRERPFFFLINLATGGGWPVDLSRYNGIADMYVDFVRVYQGN